MSNITIKNLSFAYDGGDMVFNQVHLNLDASWKLGLVGRNGRGKTTLLHILQNKLPYTGTIESSLSFMYFPMTIDNTSQTVGNLLNVYIPIEKQWEVYREATLLSFNLDSVLDQSFNTLSGGEKTKLLLAMCFIHQDQFVLLDEPTNHIDADTRQQITRYLQEKAGFIVVSHDRSFLNAVTDHTVAIEQTALRLYQGNFAVYEAEKTLRDQSEQAENTKLRQDITRLQETAREKAQWSQSRENTKYGNRTTFNSKNRGDKGFEGARAARTMKRSKNLLKRKDDEVIRKEQLLKDIESTDTLSMTPLQAPSNRLLSIDELTIGYHSQPLFEPLKFELHQGEIIAVTGPNGIGKSALIQAITDEPALIQKGTVHWASQVRVSFIQQDTSHLSGSLVDFSLEHHITHESLLSMLYKLGVPRTVFDQTLEHMSEGQKKRVELAKSLLTPAHVYIWDEPLNYLDVFNQQQIEQLILEMHPTMLVIEHDDTFLTQINAQKIPLVPTTNV